MRRFLVSHTTGGFSWLIELQTHGAGHRRQAICAHGCLKSQHASLHRDSQYESGEIILKMVLGGGVQQLEICVHG